MRVNLTQKDWLAISAYLDGRLNVTDRADLESRLESDSEFNSAFLQIQYTRKLLRSMPQKRAPRNFTLSAQYVKKSARKLGINQFFGWASAASAIALAAIFAWSNLFVYSAKMSAPAPMLAAAPESAMDSSAAMTADENASTPMIITWGQSQQAYGKGGGGGGNDTGAFGSVAGGEESVVSQEMNPMTAATESPMIEPKVVGTVAPTESSERGIEVDATPVPSENGEVTANQDSITPDPSTLILGLPEPGTEGETISSNAIETKPYTPPMPASTIWMIGLGTITLVFAALAVFLRKR